MKTKSKRFAWMIALAIFSATAPLAAAGESKIAFVNFKTCVENSKTGKQEQANFEKMKKQMEEVLAEKEKSLKEISAKMNDEDYLDSLSSDAEADLKHKFRTLNQEFAQHQQQFLQILQQQNFKIIQKINQEINEASKVVAKNQNLDIIFNEESTFYFNPDLDISEDIVSVMDENVKEEAK